MSDISAQVARDLAHELTLAEEEIAALKKVAEAAVPLCKAIGDTNEYWSLWLALDDALREAGYLKEKGDE